MNPDESRVDPAITVPQAGSGQSSRRRVLARRSLICAGALTIAFILAGPFYLYRHDDVPSMRGMRLRPITTHDMGQHLLIMQQFDMTLRSGVVYPRWLRDINFGYGGPYASFYPPAFYYITSVLNLVFRDWSVTLFACSILAMALSGLSLYGVSRRFYGRAACMVAALFYMLLPYHLIELYWRGAMAEFLSFILVPLAVYSAYNAALKGGLRRQALLACLYALLIVTEVPISLLLTYLLLILSVALSVWVRGVRPFLRIGAAIVFGSLLTSFYLPPAVIETRLIFEPYSVLWPYAASYIDVLPTNQYFLKILVAAFAISGVSLLGIVIVISATPHPERGSDSGSLNARPARDALSPRSLALLWVGMAAFAIFMCTSFSSPVSAILPRIQVVNYPWRWLVIASVFLALSTAGCIDGLGRTRPRAPRALLGRAAIVLIIAGNAVFTIHSVVNGALSNEPLVPAATDLHSAFTPAGSTHTSDLPDTPLASFQSGKGQGRITKWDPQARALQVIAAEPSSLRLRLYNFPGWSAALDSRPIAIRGDKDGAMLVDIPPGGHDLKLSFGATTIRRVGLAVSAASVLILALLLLFERRLGPQLERFGI